MSPEELAYIAGIIDGEGTIGVRRCKNQQGKRYYGCAVSVSNTDERLILWLSERFPGAVDFRDQRHNPQAKPLYRISWNARRSDVLVAATLPYLVIKRAQADLYLRMRALVGHGQPLSEENKAEREAIVVELHGLNRRGRAS